MPITHQTEEFPESEILESLHPFVREWFTSTFKEFSPPQRYAIRNIQQGVNCLISSPTGSGKTLSAFLAIINELVTRADTGQLEDKVYCIYISPLKALANDINRNLKEPLAAISKISKRYQRELPIRVGTRTGDTTTSERAKMLERPPHILITTPESLSIALTSVKFSQMLKLTRYLIIDEIHALAENKRGTHLSLGIERLAKHATFTRIGLSATVAPLDEIAKYLVGYEDPEQKIFRDCRIVDVQYLKRLDLKVLSPVDDIMNVSHTRLQDATYELLHELIQSHRTTLVFTNTRSGTERVVHQLKDRYPKAYANVLDADEEQEGLREAEGETHERLSEEAELGESDTEIIDREKAAEFLSKPSEDIDEDKVLSEIAKRPKSLIGAHHGSLSKQHRLRIESMLKAGELKSVVCSTSLELGIDIGFIDLVVLLGSPKSVARALQRIGRSGHKLHEEAKGRIIVMDRDDLVECSVLLKAAIEKKIDRVNIPKNALDVLAQQLYGMAIEDVTTLEDAWRTIKSSYSYDGLTRKEFDDTLMYLSGEYTQLTERNIYGKIWIDRESGTFGKRGKLARLIYMTNVGTIPDETSVHVKIGEHTIGTITEDFAERLKPGDVFVLGGEPYEFRFTRGMTAQVKTSAGRMPTVPNWISEMLPLSYDLALEIQNFRKYMDQWFGMGKPKEEVKDWIRSYLYVDERGVEAIWRYCHEQYAFSVIPHRHRILLEHFKDGNKKYVFVHSLHGRRVNDVLARALAYVNGRITGRDVEVSITDNGFYLKSTQPIHALRALKLIREDELQKLMEIALDQSEVLKRRFRHCAGRALMILRNYKGQSKSVGRQQISSMLIINAVRRIGNDFPILKEARREILEDLMDIHHARDVVRQLQSGAITVEERSTDLPSPFAFNLVLQGYVDILKVEDRIEFVRRMHDLVLQEIGERPKKPKERSERKDVLPAVEFTYERLWEEQEAVKRRREEDFQGYLKDELRKVTRRIGLDADYYYHANRLIDGDTEGYPQKFKDWLHTLVTGTVPKVWHDDLIKFFIEKERLL
jgi:ATP-dependent Lhr-like helicase